MSGEMTTFYFIRHGEMDTAMAGKKIYKGSGHDMLTLSARGIEQMREAAADTRLAGARSIITSPYGRALHSAAILSKGLKLDLRVETDLHEWRADGVTYGYLPEEEAEKNYRSLIENDGRHPEGGACIWESAGQMKERVMAVLDRYRDHGPVIVVCHGILMQYVLGIDHPRYGQIEAFVVDR